MLIKPGKSTKKSKKKSLPVLGWREWVSLPELRIALVKAKIDTGAQTSALHAAHLKYYRRQGKTFVKFTVHPLQKTTTPEVICHAQVIEMRKIKSSTGHVTVRPVILTDLKIGDENWPIEVTLVNRDVMGFRMLIGRQAIRKKFLVDPGKSYLSLKGQID